MRWLWCLLVLVGCQGEKVGSPPVDAAGAESEADASTGDATSDARPPVDASLDSPIDSGIDSPADSAAEILADSGTSAPDTSVAETSVAETSVAETSVAETSADVVTAEAWTPDVVTDGGFEPSDPQCGTHKAGPMVWSGAPANFCIDAREVSRGEYMTFVDDPTKPAQPDFCDWNTSYAPAFSVLGDAHPITGIDFCDAVAFCAWAGKHVCGALTDGKPLGSEQPVASQWAYACVAGDLTTPGLYSTGAEPATGVCGNGTGASSTVTSYPSCVGPSAPWNRVRNLTGNVREWDAGGCHMPGLRPGTTAADRMGIDCAVRGGSFQQVPLDGKCVTGVSFMIDQQNEYTGIRCCKGPP